MEEPPTVWEGLRSIQAALARMEQAQALYVTQEQRESDKRIHTLELENLSKDQVEDRARIKALEDDKVQTRRIVLSAFVLPILILVGAWLLGVKP
ncbi:hypothetical protein ACIQ9R_37530 [Streptomyces sp. NPDC094447]|uniref:hypothetical protein n=1 Tax=Streptomyces sp. NPDC094447 TaxID=3366062 RepID=UPI0037F2F77C